MALIESGFAWLAPLLWRFDKDWKGIWREVPWVKRLPSEYVYQHVRATTAPAHLPREQRAIRQLLEMMDVARLLAYASDYPRTTTATAWRCCWRSSMRRPATRCSAPTRRCCTDSGSPAEHAAG